MLPPRSAAITLGKISSVTSRTFSSANPRLSASRPTM